MIVLNCCKLVRIVPAIKFVPHGGITLHSINRGSISLRALKKNQRIFGLARLMNYGYCRKARSSWRGNTARRERPARTPETLNSLLETPANPAVVGDRMRATDQRIRGLERRLQMLRNEQQSLIVRAIILGDRRD